MSTPPKGRGMGRGLGALGLGGPPPQLAPVAVPEVKPEKPAKSNGETPAPLPSSNGTARVYSNPVVEEAVKGNGKVTGDISTDTNEANDTSKEARKSGLMLVSITSIAPNPYQPRKHIDPDILAELSQSIRENGLIQPPVVSYNPDYDPDYKPTDEEETGSIRKERKARYLLIAGERRWQASKLAGITSIPVVLKEATPIQMLELALVENIQRADLNPLEEAQAYKQLMQEFKLTQEAVAHKVGKSRAAVANALRLFDLPDLILQSVYSNQITEGHARALLMVHNPGDQNRLHHDVIAKAYSVRQTEEMARRMNALSATAGFAPGEEKPKLLPAQRETHDIEEQFRSALGLQVHLTRNEKGQGKLVISYSEKDQLNELYNKIVGPDI